MAVLGENGGAYVKLSFWDPQKAYPCTEPRLLTDFASMSRGGVLAAGDF